MNSKRRNSLVNKKRAAVMETATRQALPDNRRLPSTTLGTPIFRNDQRQIQILIHRGKRYRPHPVTSFQRKVGTVGVALHRK